MAYELKEGCGTLFPNEKKTTDKHPDYNGKCMHNGALHWYSLWKNTAKSGKVYLSTQIGKAVESNGGGSNSNEVPF